MDKSNIKSGEVTQLCRGAIPTYSKKNVCTKYVLTMCMYEIFLNSLTDKFMYLSLVYEQQILKYGIR